jgi:hypothetical protein
VGREALGPWRFFVGLTGFQIGDGAEPAVINLEAHRHATSSPTNGDAILGVTDLGQVFLGEGGRKGGREGGRGR